MQGLTDNRDMLVAYLVLASQRLVDVPAIAHIAGITVGATTIPMFERRYRPGLASVGGHPLGARGWYDRTAGVSIHADGFNYSGGDGEILDSVDVGWESEKGISRKVPRIRLRLGDLGILAKLRPGMSPSQVEKALHLKLVDGHVQLGGLIKYAEKLGNKDNDRYTLWKAHFSFGDKGLDGVSVSGD